MHTCHETHRNKNENNVEPPQGGGASGAEDTKRKNTNASRQSSHRSQNEEVQGKEMATRHPLAQQGRTAA